MSEIDNDIATAQNLLHKIIATVESVHVGDTSALLQHDGWHLLGVATNESSLTIPHTQSRRIPMQCLAPVIHLCSRNISMSKR